MNWVLHVLNTCVFLVAFVLKAPQILKVLRANSTRGINMNSLLLECWCFSVLLCYPCARGYPLPTYCEFILLVTQDLILLSLVMRDRRLVTPRNLALLAALAVFFFSVAMDRMPESVLVTLISSCTPLSATSKILQLYSIIRHKDAGMVSPGTWFMGSLTSAARLTTHILGSGDMMLMMNSGQASLLCASIATSAVVYRPKQLKRE